jgi:hypothetical protein
MLTPELNSSGLNSMAAKEEMYVFLWGLVSFSRTAETQIKS